MRVLRSSWEHNLEDDNKMAGAGTKEGTEGKTTKARIDGSSVVSTERGVNRTQAEEHNSANNSTKNEANNSESRLNHHHHSYNNVAHGQNGHANDIRQNGRSALGEESTAAGGHRGPNSYAEAISGHMKQGSFGEAKVISPRNGSYAEVGNGAGHYKDGYAGAVIGTPNRNGAADTRSPGRVSRTRSKIGSPSQNHRSSGNANFSSPTQNGRGEGGKYGSPGGNNGHANGSVFGSPGQKGRPCRFASPGQGGGSGSSRPAKTQSPGYNGRSGAQRVVYSNQYATAIPGIRIGSPISCEGFWGHMASNPDAGNGLSDVGSKASPMMEMNNINLIAAIQQATSNGFHNAVSFEPGVSASFDKQPTYWIQHGASGSNGLGAVGNGHGGSNQNFGRTRKQSKGSKGSNSSFKRRGNSGRYDHTAEAGVTTRAGGEGAVFVNGLDGAASNRAADKALDSAASNRSDTGSSGSVFHELLAPEATSAAMPQIVGTTSNMQHMFVSQINSEVVYTADGHATVSEALPDISQLEMQGGGDKSEAESLVDQPVGQQGHQSTAKKVDLGEDLERIFKINNCYSSEDALKKRSRILGVIRKAVDEWIKSLKPRSFNHQNARGNVVLYGSCKLEVADENADLDLLVIGPSFVARSDFLNSLPGRLGRLQDVRRLRKLPEAFVPVIKFSIADVEIDLTFARIHKPVPQNEDALMEDKCLKGIDPKCLVSLNGYKATCQLLEIVPDVRVFKTVLRAVKLWAKMKGLYSNILGFLGGASWAILVVKACQIHMEQSSPEEHTPINVLAVFFKEFARWTWPNPVYIRKVENTDSEGWDPVNSHQDREHVMPIITSSSPHMNSAVNMNLKNRRLIEENLKEADILFNEILAGNRKLDELFTEIDIYKAFPACLTIITTGDEEKYMWFGLVESKLRFLREYIETKTSVVLRLWPKPTISTTALGVKQEWHMGYLSGPRIDGVLEPNFVNILDQFTLRVKDQFREFICKAGDQWTSHGHSHLNFDLTWTTSSNSYNSCRNGDQVAGCSPTPSASSASRATTPISTPASTAGGGQQGFGNNDYHSHAAGHNNNSHSSGSGTRHHAGGQSHVQQQPPYQHHHHASGGDCPPQVLLSTSYSAPALFQVPSQQQHQQGTGGIRTLLPVMPANGGIAAGVFQSSHHHHHHHHHQSASQIFNSHHDRPATASTSPKFFPHHALSPQVFSDGVRTTFSSADGPVAFPIASPSFQNLTLNNNSAKYCRQSPTVSPNNTTSQLYSVPPPALPNAGSKAPRFGTTPPPNIKPKPANNHQFRSRSNVFTGVAGIVNLDYMINGELKIKRDLKTTSCCSSSSEAEKVVKPPLKPTKKVDVTDIDERLRSVSNSSDTVAPSIVFRSRINHQDAPPPSPFMTPPPPIHHRNNSPYSSLIPISQADVTVPPPKVRSPPPPRTASPAQPTFSNIEGSDRVFSKTRPHVSPRFSVSELPDAPTPKPVSQKKNPFSIKFNFNRHHDEVFK